LTPIVFENDGKGLSIARDRRFSAGDQSLLRWCLSHGVRTGISFRIRMPRGRGASLNFYSAHSHTPKELEAAIQRLFLVGHQVHTCLEPRLSRRYDKLLSDRETECLEWIALGKSNPEIAALLGLSPETVKEHVQSLFQKLKVNGRAHAVSRGHMLAYLG
jgi:DNA-binding CsgD family transcriptional regulator